MKARGFTLVEMMVVVGIIGILAAVSLPAYKVYTNKAKVVEALILVKLIQRQLSKYYERWGDFPDSSEDAGLGNMNAYSGKYVKNFRISKGVIIFDIQIDKEEYVMWMQAAVSDVDSPAQTVVWLCMQTTAPVGFKLIGHEQINLLSILPKNLRPSSC